MDHDGSRGTAGCGQTSDSSAGRTERIGQGRRKSKAGSKVSASRMQLLITKMGEIMGGAVGAIRISVLDMSSLRCPLAKEVKELRRMGYISSEKRLLE